MHTQPLHLFQGALTEPFLWARLWPRTSHDPGIGLLFHWSIQTPFRPCLHLPNQQSRISRFVDATVVSKQSSPAAPLAFSTTSPPIVAEYHVPIAIMPAIVKGRFTT